MGLNLNFLRKFPWIAIPGTDYYNCLVPVIFILTDSGWREKHRLQNGDSTGNTYTLFPDCGDTVPSFYGTRSSREEYRTARTVVWFRNEVLYLERMNHCRGY